MVDEVQDFSPLELAVLLDTTSKQRSVTLAGDTAQAIAPEHGFSNWTELLADLGIAHERVEPLRVSYRSTREIVELAEHVLGPLQGDPDQWKTGDEPMTDAQRSYLETLCRQTGEDFDESLSKADASKRIEELRERSPRLAQE